MSLFQRKVIRIAPPAVLTDKVVPVHYWDHFCVDAVVNFMLRFDHKLDVGKLRGSLEKLLDRPDGWRKLGARVRLNASGKLDYHVPSKYTEQRPAISYHHRPYNMSITQHPLASRLPKASSSVPSSSSASTNGGPRIVGRGDDFVSLMRRPGDPTCFEDYLYAERPMLGLHIVTFNDATLVSLCSSHILFDAMGRKELLDAWSLTLQGREDEVLPLIENDPLASLGSQKETATTKSLEQYKHANKQLGLLQMMTLGLRQALDKILHRKPIEETRIICVPAAYVDSLRKDALLALQLRADDDDHVEKKVTPPQAFLSDGDVLCAWWTRHIVSSRIRNAAKSRQTVAIMNMMGLRRLLSQASLLPAKKSALVANAMLAVPAFMAAKNLVGKPLGHAAAVLREAIGQLGTRPQVEALLALQRAANDKKGGLPALFGDAGMHMVVCTNWTQAGFYDVDFSAAVMTDDGQEQVPGSPQKKKTAGTDTNMEGARRLEQDMSMPASRVARPTNVQMNLITASTPAFMMSIFSILGRDAYGNYWIMGILRKGYWAKIEQALRQEPSDTTTKH